MSVNQLKKENYLASTKWGYFGFVNLIALIVLLIEGYLALLFSAKEINITELIVYHLSLSVLLLIICVVMYLFKIDTRLYWLIFFMTSIAAVIGAFIAVISCLICMLFHKSADLDWLYELDLDDTESENEQLYYRLIASQEDFADKSDLTPISEIILEGSTQEKRLVIGKMARYFSPKFAQLLRQAVKSKENSIRVQAATVIANIESTFSKKLIALENELEQDEDSPEVLYKLAKHCDTYAYCGILTDSKLIEQYYRQSIKYYQKYQSVAQNYSEALSLTLGRLSIRLNNNKEALQYLDIVLSKKTDSEKISPQLFLWYIEVLYRLDDYSKITKFCTDYCNRISGNAAAERMAEEAIELWTKK